MGIKYVKGDLFDVVDEYKKTNVIWIPHCCNNRGKWGAGFVIPLGKKYPKARQAYYDWYNGNSLDGYTSHINGSDGKFKMGLIQLVWVEERVQVINMVAQTLQSDKPLSYDKLFDCMDSVVGCYKKHYFRDAHTKIVCPMFGAGLAGGSWKIISTAIEECWVAGGLDVTVCYL